MNKLVFLALASLTLVGCASRSNDTYDKRADAQLERQEKAAQKAVDSAPKWMSELPKSNNAVYANGSSYSGDMSMADNKAKLVALGKICMAAGGEVDQRSTLYRADVGESTVETADMAIRSMCRRVDISGTEIVEVKRIASGTGFRSYVLVALPTGKSNAIQQRNDAVRAQAQANKKAPEIFKEMDAEKPRQD